MTEPRITTVSQLHSYLDAALQLEHATIPPYLTALYSLHPGANPEARAILRVVVVEEMLHLTLVANVLNAIGGSPDLTRPGFTPAYPAYLPDGERDFQVDLQPFGKDAIATCLNIERPGHAPDEESRVVPRKRPHGQLPAASPDQDGTGFYSIGEFYEEIGRGLRHLHQRHAREGRPLFSGDPSRQAGPEYFYSGGGNLIRVTDLDSAQAALRLITEQGEGLRQGIYDAEGELSHYYRFSQLVLGRYYHPGDQPDHPTGPPLETNWDAVYPVLRNARLADYPPGSQLWEAAVAFNESYAGFLALLTRAFNGQPELLTEAVWAMFRLRDAIVALIRNPVPGRGGAHAGPTFEIPDMAGHAGDAWAAALAEGKRR